MHVTLQAFQQVKLEHWYREANKAAHVPAKIGCSQVKPFISYTQPSFVVMEALNLDCNSILIPRPIQFFSNIQ